MPTLAVNPETAGVHNCLIKKKENTKTRMCTEVTLTFYYMFLDILIAL